MRAKEYRNTAPHHNAMKENMKQRQPDAYQKAQKRGKALKAERKKVADEKVAEAGLARRKNLWAMLVPTRTLKPEAKRTR